MSNIKAVNYLKHAVGVLVYGWIDSGRISRKEKVKNSRFSVYVDMIACFRKYHITVTQYSKLEIFNLSDIEKDILGKQLWQENKRKEEWKLAYNKNWRFLDNYTKLKWEGSDRKREKRNLAYAKQYGLGDNCKVQYGVMFIREHYLEGKLIVGKNVFFARGCDLDYTGNLTIRNNCLFSENVKILTHKHSLFEGHDTIPTPLNIAEDVRFGARASVLPDVKRIGRGGMIAANAVVHHEVPPYSIVMGNPAKVVGFRFTPDQIIEYEEELYSAEDRLCEELLVANYKKYYLDRITEISTLLK